MQALTVVGSVNADLVFTLQRVPRAGETLAARGLATHPGGKARGGSAAAALPLAACACCSPSSLISAAQGGNQAAAAARLGCTTRLVAQLGRDAQAHM